jgi:hypothetical protein
MRDVRFQSNTLSSYEFFSNIGILIVFRLWVYMKDITTRILRFSLAFQRPTSVKKAQLTRERVE